jgi:hypothetical protein
LTLDGIQLDGGAIYTVFAVGLAGGEPALDDLITVDNQTRENLRERIW